MAKWSTDAANIAAQRDEAIARAVVAEERLRAVETDLATAWADRDKARLGQREMALQALASMGQAQEAYEAQIAAEAELARIRAADRTSITVRTTEAAKMRKGQAI
jgi:hypothetical protein